MKRAHLAIVVALFIAGCGWFGTSKPQDAGELQLIEAQLLAEVGEARADSVEQCRVLLYGAKPCGGHWHSLVYSTAEGDETRIRSLAEQYTELQSEINRTLGLASDCMMEPVPTAELVGGRCVAGQ